MSRLLRLVSGSLDGLGRILLRTPPPPKENSTPTPEPTILSSLASVTRYPTSIDEPRYPYSDEPGVHVIARGPARLLFHLDLFHKHPRNIRDIVRMDDESYEAIDGWQDLGATKTGLLQKDNDVFVSLVEMTRERFEAFRGRQFQLVACWMVGDSQIEIKHYPCVEYMGLINASTRGEASLPAYFRIAKPNSSFSQVFGPSSVSPPIFEGKAIGKALPPPPDARLYATLSL